MRLSALGFLTGIVLFQQLAELPGVYWSALALPLIVWSILHPRIRLFAYLGLGVCWSLLYAHFLLSASLDPLLESQDLMVTGSVSSLPDHNPARTRFEFTIKEFWKIEPAAANLSAPTLSAPPTLTNIERFPNKILLNWYRPPEAINVGQQWRLMVRLKRPHGFLNPGGFDYEGYLFRKGIGATGYVKSPKIVGSNSAVQNVASTNNILLNPDQKNYTLNAMRERLRDSIDNALGKSEFTGIIAALAVGDRQNISQQQWHVLTSTGTNHLMAISGLHIGLVAGFVFFLAQWLWKWSAYATLRLPAKKAGAIAGLTAAVVYAALAGFAIPTQRALVMVAVLMVSILWQRKVEPSRMLSVALFLVLLIDPLAVLDVGFWLSFAAVTVIVFGISGRVRAQGLWWKWGRTQWLVFIGLAPLLLVFFQRVSLFSPLANIVAIPWVSAITVPMSLLGTVLLDIFPMVGTLVLKVAELSLQLLWPLLSRIAALPQPQWLQIAPTLWALIPAGIGIAWLLAPRGLPARWLGVIWLLPLFLIPKKSLEPGAAVFTLLDVGQGLAAVIQTDSHVLVYDTGPKFPSGFNTGDAVIVPFLRQKGINKVDVLVVSHGDNDHIGGAMSLLEAIPVDRIYSSVVDKFSPGSTDFCNKDIFWEWEEVNFRFIHPMNDYFLNTAPDSGKRNDLSCVLKVDTNASSVLLAGDIEKNVEKKLINGNSENKLELESDIILAPHHGSRTSSTARFILEVKPKYALFAVGYKNRYGFPKSDVVERYLQNNARVLDTAQHGAISFTLHRDADPELTELYRVSAKRYWHSDFSKWYGF